MNIPLQPSAQLAHQPHHLPHPPSTHNEMSDSTQSPPSDQVHAPQPRVFRNPYFNYDAPPLYVPPTFAATNDLWNDAELEEADRWWRGARANPAPLEERYRDEERGSEREAEARPFSEEAEAQHREEWQCREEHVRLGFWLLVALVVTACALAAAVVWMFVTQ